MSRPKTRCLMLLILAAAVCNIVWALPAESAMTHKEERQMGREVLEKIKAQVKLVDDPAVNDYINNLGQKILQAAGPQPFDYKFYVVDSPVLNAFAIPGGHIFFFSGLITSMKSEGELASVVAHEIGHVTNRHISDRMSQSLGLNLAAAAGILAGTLVGGPIGTAVALGTIGGSIQTMLAYSREDEREADVSGLDYLVKSGYDPQFMADAFRILSRNAIRAPDGMPTYLTTHPGLSERISSVENMAATHPMSGRVLGRGDEKAFMAVKNRLMALTADPRSARHYFEAMLKRNPQTPLAHHGQGILYQKQQNYSRARQEFETALKLDPANANYMADLGHILFLQKDYQAAMTVLNRAVILKPKYVRALYLLARTYEAMGVFDRARELYERAVIQDPQHAEALYFLGNLYGRQGNLTKAHLHTGLYFAQINQPKKALFHLRKAEQNASSAPPDIQRRIDKAIEDMEQAKEEEEKRKRQMF